MADYLYVCEFSNGTVKVGRSVTPIARIEQHASRVACVGVALANSQHEECPEDAVLQAEAALIRKCAERSAKRHSNEWFDGISFADACAWMRECVNTEYPKPVAQERRQRVTSANDGPEVERRYQCHWDENDRHYWVDTRPDEPHWPDTALFRWDLRQSDWHRIWPELIDHPCAIYFAPRHPHRDGPPAFADWVKSWPAGYDWTELVSTMPEAAIEIVRSIWPVAKAA